MNITKTKVMYNHMKGVQDIKINNTTQELVEDINLPTKIHKQILFLSGRGNFRNKQKNMESI